MSNPPRLRDFLGFQRPRSSPFAPADRAPEASRAGAKRERGCAVPSRRRERPLGAALKPYRKFSQNEAGDGAQYFGVTGWGKFLAQLRSTSEASVRSD